MGEEQEGEGKRLSGQINTPHLFIPLPQGARKMEEKEKYKVRHILP
jgi:hypothetical protein